ncbi:MAG: acetylglutamate kinase [Desulfomonile tiedjei]|uniref:Acetylglutamate kinase n=1 Tax=Desulfomonile tiedjei TaxID=2358 RepID=A0A9D6Z4E2_9BACT|nr:acetylglutamate kinase [Desulfomonile tiedjei]
MDAEFCENLPPEQRAETLAEALPYIRAFRGKRIVIKYGGSAMTDERLKKFFAEDIALMSFIGIRPVIVHGGGPQIGALLKKIGKESRFVSGLRVTDAETMDVVEMVLVAKVNKDVVSLINSYGGRAVGISGRDGDLIKAKKAKRIAGVDEDLGLVGDVDKINSEIITCLEAGGFVPVVAPVGAGPGEKPFNINADTAAGALSAALKAEKFLLLTDVPGVLDGENSLISSVSEDQAEELIRLGVVSGGMIPKIRCCLNALRGGVPKAHIIDGRVPHALLLETLTDEGIGTEIVRERAPGT